MGSRNHAMRKDSNQCLALLALAVFVSAVPAAAATPTTLTVGVAQLALETKLTANRDKIIRFIGEAKSTGCRLVVFPETALCWPEGTSKADIDAAMEQIRQAVDAADIYALVGGLYKRNDQEKQFERLLAINPDGKFIQTYNKMWSDSRFNDAPGLFEIDGVPCAACLCADRWIRSVEELPAMAGAKILIECSNNYANEWLPEQEWFWYVPRALRNQVFVIFANTAKEDWGQGTPGHGHSAFFGPDGTILQAAGEESDRLLVATLDLSLASGNEALTRREHPLLSPFWKLGVEMLAGSTAQAAPHQPLVSPQVELKIAAAQLACSRSVEQNLKRIELLIQEAKRQKADVVVLPELAVTGAREEDVRNATAEQMIAAVERLQAAAKGSQIAVVCGLPWIAGEKRTNCAVAIDADGTVRTRYAQIAVDRPELFTAGKSTLSMWFDIKGVPCVLSVGHDDLWSEMAEMAAWRGAQVHLHLAYDRDTSAEGQLKRKQLWANLASFRTFTATVNAASPVSLSQPSAQATGGSIIWEDYHRGANRKTGGNGPYSAVRLAEASESETILYATQKVPKTNPQFATLTQKTNGPMTPWYVAGAAAIYAEQEAGNKGRESGDREQGTRTGQQFSSSGPYFDGKFKGRIAYSADGNHNDPDDWAASPLALAIFADAGLRDPVVHFHYNCILPETNAEWEKIHAESVLGTAKRYGYDLDRFFDCRKALDACVADLKRQIDASTADNPLYFIVAGPMEVPYLALQKSDPEKRKFVYCISHSRWNDGFASRYKFTFSKRSVIESGVNWVQIADQNRLLSLSPYGKPGPPESFEPFGWMRDSAEEKVRFLWERMLVSTRPDPSDAGMAYFLVSGDEATDPVKLKRLISDHVPPAPLPARKSVRLEAENFRVLKGFELEDKNERSVSHRLSVKSTGQPAAEIETHLREPFMALEDRYDLEVRYQCPADSNCRFVLAVQGTQQKESWASVSNGKDWVTQTLSDVKIRQGDTITILTDGGPSRIDYIQLNRK